MNSLLSTPSLARQRSLQRLKPDVQFSRNKQFNAILKKHEDRRIERQLKELEKFSVFHNFSRTAKTKILPKLYTKKLIRGQKLFKENDKLEAIYVIKDGEFEITK